MLQNSSAFSKIYDGNFGWFTAPKGDFNKGEEHSQKFNINKRNFIKAECIKAILTNKINYFMFKTISF
jgi:hypothetical protein